MAELTAPAAPPPPGVMDIGPQPEGWGSWFREMWDHRAVISILARKDFQVRYKRASFGVLWAVLMPLLQGIIFVAVFSRVGGFNHTPFNYSAYVLAGTLGWGYFNSSLSTASTAIVDGASFTDKVWFPRAVLPLAPALGNLVGLGLSMLILIVAMPLVHAHFALRTLLLIPGCILLVSFTLSAGLLASALHVYFRDVKFIVQAGLMVWFYVTPIVYPASRLHHIGPWLDFNPLTGIAAVFQTAAAGSFGPILRAVLVSVGVTIVLFVAGVEAHRRHDRLFVDQM
jgi:ABC-type polysaccharide/polyol phosphate export permease